ncbi:MAG: flagellar biosynthesis protein FlhA [Candidatus Muirbacterium halophilum]|nr:flagellar biosynthesis protein FlhA [Candidatus Muirbacterium halophilum]MCK9476169.1 flagellar biosynthesis protein FlhA [Candidatus Muirbacterium halophilum]
MEQFTKWVQFIIDRSELFPIIGIIALIVIMIIPIPTALLDFLMGVNLFISLMILIMTMFIERIIDFSVFPTLLLVTTLFRLSLNISSTRLILLQGARFDGKFVKTFGDFVVGGNYIVGFVIFIILLIVQLMIITKGSGRIAEVAARFTLDAMPGKQMAVDNDLQNGLLTDVEAKERREEIRREADFYGSMDGASKFVQGDAMAGLIITGINIVGGILIGVFMHGEDIAGAMKVYSLFTIGDGIASQLPSLLISVGAGIIVSRSASKGDLGNELIRQFTTYWQPLVIGSSVMLFLSFIPGMPKFGFWFLAIVFGGLGYVRLYAANNPIEDETEKNKGADGSGDGGSEGEKTAESVLDSILHVDKLELEIGIGLIPLVDASQGGDLKDRITMLRREVALELGLMLPKVRIRDNIQLSPNNYVIKLKGMEISRGEVFVDKYFAMNTGFASEEIEGQETIDPIYGMQAFWIDEIQKETAENAGFIVVDAATTVITHIKEIVSQYSHELLGREELELLVDYIKNDYKSLVEELIPAKLPLSEVQKILQNLLKEGVSIRNLVTIFETLIEAKNYGIENIDNLTEHVRASLARQIVEIYIDKNENLLNVINIDPSLEKNLSGKITRTVSGQGFLVLSPQEAEKFRNSIADEVTKVAKEVMNFVILSSPELRIYLKRWFDREPAFARLAVLSYNEIPGNLKVRACGIIK